MTLDEQQSKYVAALRDNQKLIDRLAERKGWPASTLTAEVLGVGWDERARRVTFPVFADEASRLAGFRRYLPGGKPKMIGDKGLALEPYPPPESLPNAPELWIVEGEPDVLSAHAMGLWPTCGLPGTQSWKPAWAKRFRAYTNVVVCFDCDVPGRKAAQYVAEGLASAGLGVEIEDLSPNRDNGYDLGDYLLEASAS